MKRVIIPFCLFLLFCFVGCGSEREKLVPPIPPEVRNNNNYTIYNNDWAYWQGGWRETINQMQAIGLLGEHKLIRRRSGNQLHGNIEGSFYFLGGSVSGEFGTANTLSFAWGVNKKIFISSLPLNKIIFIQDNSLKDPIIRFKFSIPDINTHDNSIDRENLNDFIKPDYIVSATVRINSKDLEKEIYLPLHL